MGLDRSNSDEESSLPWDGIAPFKKGFDKVLRGAITRSCDGTSPSLSAQRVVDLEARLHMGKSPDPLSPKEVDVETVEDWDADEEEEGEIIHRIKEGRIQTLFEQNVISKGSKFRRRRYDTDGDRK
ncbi:hypothetical protein U1Q18_014532 [Sarracenia purpurea var. burkii]